MAVSSYKLENNDWLKMWKNVNQDEKSSLKMRLEKMWKNAFQKNVKMWKNVEKQEIHF